MCALYNGENNDDVIGENLHTKCRSKSVYGIWKLIVLNILFGQQWSVSCIWPTMTTTTTMNVLAKLRATVLQLIIILVCRIKCYLLLFMVRFDMNAVHIVQFEITVQSAKLFFWQVFLYYYFFFAARPKEQQSR